MHFVKYILLILTFSLFLSCNDDPDEYKLKVICIDSQISGFYVVDAGSTQTFTGTMILNNTYEFEREFEDIETLEVTATKEKGDASLSIKIYKNQRIVKEKTLGSDDTSDPELDLQLVYEDGEEDTTSSKSLNYEESTLP